jgi:hypothetical protein
VHAAALRHGRIIAIARLAVDLRKPWIRLRSI